MADNNEATTRARAAKRVSVSSLPAQSTNTSEAGSYKLFRAAPAAMDVHIYNSVQMMAATAPVEDEPPEADTDEEPEWVAPAMGKVKALDDEQKAVAENTMESILAKLNRMSTIDEWMHRVRDEDDIRMQDNATEEKQAEGRKRADTIKSAKSHASSADTDMVEKRHPSVPPAKSPQVAPPLGTSRGKRPAFSSAKTAQVVPSMATRDKRPALRDMTTTQTVPTLSTQKSLTQLSGDNDVTDPVTPPMGNAFCGDGYWAGKYSPIAERSPAFVPEHGKEPDTSTPTPTPTNQLRTLEDPSSRTAYEETRDTIRIYAQHVAEANEDGRAVFDPTESSFPTTLTTAATPATVKVTAADEYAAADANLKEKAEEFSDATNLVDPGSVTARIQKRWSEDKSIIAQYVIRNLRDLNDDKRWGSVNESTGSIETILDRQRDALRRIRERCKSSDLKMPAEAHHLVWATHFSELKYREWLDEMNKTENDEGYTYDNFLRSIMDEAQQDADDDKALSKRQAPSWDDLALWSAELRKMEEREKERQQQREETALKRQKTVRAVRAIQGATERNEADEADEAARAEEMEELEELEELEEMEEAEEVDEAEAEGALR